MTLSEFSKSINIITLTNFLIHRTVNTKKVTVDQKLVLEEIKGKKNQHARISKQKIINFKQHEYR